MEEYNNFVNRDDFIENKNLVKGMLILLREHPCEITYISYSKSGKHGFQKMLVEGFDIFTKVKYEDIFRVAGQFTQLLKPIMTSYIVTNLNGNTLHALDEKYNQEIQIDLANNNLCDKVSIYLTNMKTCTVKILSYQTLHKIIEINNN
jgi:translation elongation factor P/translation initiation factor 5A